jgi:5-methylcytosine-specific restriction endonuclease McrA
VPKKTSQERKIDRFKAWLVERGAELLISTNDYEVVRYRAGSVTSIVYRNDKNERWKYTGDAQSAWDAYKDKSPHYRCDVKSTRIRRTPAQRDVQIRTIIARDGNVCFYCGDPFSDNLPPTKEHLVSRTHQGPDTIHNLFAACSRCNSEAGHLSAAEKIRMRDRKRRGRGTGLLTRVFNLGGGCPDALIAEIGEFLDPTPSREKAS